MAYRYGDREQMTFLPPTIEDYISEDDPVRAYDVFIETLDLKELGIKVDTDQVGNSSYDPKAMLKLLVYGYSYGWRSSRKLERAEHHNLSFIWLMGGLKPDHKTIARFRKNNKEALKQVFKQCARLCIKLNLIAGNTLFVGGSKIRANASINNSWDKNKRETYLKTIDEQIESILEEAETIDTQEEDNPSLVKLQEELRDKTKLKDKVRHIMNELITENKKKVNSTDPECVNVQGRQGTHARYNAQMVVDEQHGLIVHNDVVNENNDRNQFANQINQAHEIPGKQCNNACADSGYADTSELKKIDDEGITVIVPSQEQVSKNISKPFDKTRFRYNEQQDCYICPERNQLKYKKSDKETKTRSYQIPDESVCHSCEHYGICTEAKHGRSIKRLEHEEVKRKLEEQYESESSQAIFKLRKEKVEHPFGHIKRNLGVSSFLLRGLSGVKAEMAILATCFNLIRMINIFGVQELVTKLTT